MNKSTTIIYDSNPFTTSWAAIQKIFTVNPQTFVGVTVTMFALCAALGAAAIMFLLAIVAFLARHYPNTETLALPEYTGLSMFTAMSDTTIYMLWGGGLVVGILLIALLQAIQLRFTISTAERQVIRFGELIKQSMGYVLPLLGLAGLIFVAAIFIFLVLGFVSTVMPLVVFLLGLATLFALIYISLRLAFAGYAIVSKRMGPIAAIKHSWAVTNNRVVDIIGIAAVTWLIVEVPNIILSALANVSVGTPMLVSTFDVMSLVLQIALIALAAMPMAERFVQSQAVYDKQTTAKPISPVNFLAILAVIILAPISEALNMQPGNDSINPYGALSIPSLQQDTESNLPQGSTNAY